MNVHNYNDVDGSHEEESIQISQSKGSDRSELVEHALQLGVDPSTSWALSKGHKQIRSPISRLRRHSRPFVYIEDFTQSATLSFIAGLSHSR